MYDCRLKMGRSMLISGPSSSGKTVFLTSLLMRRHEFFNEQPKRIIWYYGTVNAPNISLGIEKQDEEDIEFKRGLPTESDVSLFKDALIILDDLMENAKNNTVTSLFSKVSHHSHCFIVLLVQNFFHVSRSQSLNCHYLVFLKNPRDKLLISILSRQMFPNNSKFLVDAFHDATDNKLYAHLFLDLCADTPEAIRVRSDIFNENSVMTVYLPNKYKQFSSD